MFDTYVTVVGNVLTTPEWRRTTQTNTLVANFKVASTARRLDRENNRWVDGNSLRVRVNCWRKLAEGVASSVMLGDPVVVVGRLYTRDWVDGDGKPRLQYEMEAVAVGHDLARGRGRFTRNRPTLATSEVAGDDPERRVQGEATTQVRPGEAPPTHNELFDGDDDPMFLEPSVPSPVEGEPNRPGRPITLAVDVLAAQAADALAAQSADVLGGLTPSDDPLDEEPPDEADEPTSGASGPTSGAFDAVPSDATSSGASDDRPAADHPSADQPAGDPLPVTDRPVTDRPEPAGRQRRSRARTPVPV
ncbi:single-stranded DNA-binding protein [Solwaraspora sp. WMMA2056]|uniref:single-stranded DNA-binding protein n=1 Tax=Solwaraspora sp. WMMA2056 TaxID=3015161 RepID=UPI00259BA81C|nr:single-stranded DNA-binding protein [Solwaraspora sp. WMMA2056]WJK43046.1 single-stranded DNA-binding protein [Solwaraspora sp. WMMA2056]